jgi:hypothetical protein
MCCPKFAVANQKLRLMLCHDAQSEVGRAKLKIFCIKTAPAMTGKCYTRSTSARRRDSPRTGLTSPFPGYGPKASIPSKGFLPDPNILTRRPHRLSEQDTSSSRENASEQRGSEKPVEQPEPGMFALDSMTNLLGSNSVASVGLEEYFDVFVLWTTVPHESFRSKLVPDMRRKPEDALQRRENSEDGSQIGAGSTGSALHKDTSEFLYFSEPIPRFGLTDPAYKKYLDLGDERINIMERLIQVIVAEYGSAFEPRTVDDLLMSLKTMGFEENVVRCIAKRWKTVDESLDGGLPTLLLQTRPAVWAAAIIEGMARSWCSSSRSATEDGLGM